MDIWKENMLEDFEEGLLEYKIVEDFLADIKKEFGERDEELVKVTELKIRARREEDGRVCAGVLKSS